ncbi:MAG: Molybdenum cofactor biosynthesis protein MoaE [uncultured Thiotrichaceae bacterium]|uniref:Molybdopterin synthase catalytic subunit n=1 Tax=uncultured Thiotrichaceae bacterium TaxID=298394 RepID=A0A6S6S5B8_9GAMM|nr:MAG: Molybdenum cofactor biosynthesis protein MoaE [uncultured Thiotrichaceae bacterium]
MHVIKITEEPLSPWSELASFESEHLQGATDFGAQANFIGYMRDFNEGDNVIGMTLEHYPSMTEQKLASLAEASDEKWPILHTLIIHRTGNIKPSDPIVLVATWSAHRKAAFESCRYLMEALKSSVPFWKKEMLIDGSQRWVKKNTSG